MIMRDELTGQNFEAQDSTLKELAGKIKAMNLKDYIPETIIYPRYSVINILARMCLGLREVEYLENDYKVMCKAFQDYKRRIPNNYLKMHGKPMRRRGH